MVLSTLGVSPPERPQTEVRTQILIIEGSQTVPIIIEPGDEVTGPGGQNVEYPDEILHILTDQPKYGWIDVWQDGTTDSGKRTRLRRRVFSRNVTNLVEAHIFPLDEDMVQS